MRVLPVSALALLLSAPLSASETMAATADPAAFAESLDTCTPASHQAPHPFMKGFTIEHRITGESDGHCDYSQTMPGDMRMECRLTAEGRAGLVAEFREQAQGRMSGSTSSQPAWTSECEIVAKDGKRIPIGR